MERDLESIETAAYIENFTGGDEMARPEFEFLPSGAQGHSLVRIRGTRKIHESLMHFEGILVGEARSAHASVFEAALKLREESDMPSDVRIGMQKIALQEESVGRVRNASERGVAEEVPADAGLAADRKIRIRRCLP